VNSHNKINSASKAGNNIKNALAKRCPTGLLKTE
jgi:hypothetical protein